jgi:predicted nucleic acid-binding protein
MRTAIDTNIISALWSGEPASQGISELLGRAKDEGGLVICAPVYVELLAYPKATRTFLEEFLATTRIATEFLLDQAVWQESGAAYASYAQRRRQSKDGPSKRLLVDFIIGAHAFLKADRLLTLDAGRYRTAFPKLVMMP